jgi:hypothetical protein
VFDFDSNCHTGYRFLVVRLPGPKNEQKYAAIRKRRQNRRKLSTTLSRTRYGKILRQMGDESGTGGKDYRTWVKHAI